MASKIYKAASIYARIDGLLKSGVKKLDDRPMWYDIYKAFPPKYEPEINKPLPDIPIKNIFYKEDIARAKLHKTILARRVWTIKGIRKDEYINVYLNKLEEGLTEDEAYEHVKNMITLKSKTDTKAESVSAEAIKDCNTQVAFEESPSAAK